MKQIVLIYSTTDGHTKTICSYLQRQIESEQSHVTVVSITDTDSLDLANFDTIVIGASIHYGKHHKNVYDFIAANQALLESKINAFFTVNVVARKPEKSTPATNPYLQKFLRQISWQPQHLAVFAGKIDYQKYRFIDRQMIRLIMWITKGPTAKDTNITFTNWQQVDAFAKHIASL